MKKILVLIAILQSLHSFSQRGIGTNAPNTSSILELKSTSKGFLMPRMDRQQMEAIVPEGLSENEKNEVAGLLVYCKNCQPKGVYVFNGTDWRALKDIQKSSYSIDCDFTSVDYSGTIGTSYLFTVQFTKEYGFEETVTFSADELTVPGYTVGNPSIGSHTFTPSSTTIMVNYPINKKPEESSGTVTKPPFGSCNSIYD